MSRSFLLWITALLAVACGSTGRGADVSGGANVSFTDYRVGMTLGIVSDGYLVHQGLQGENASLRRASFYSDRRGDLSTKVADDELVAGLIKALDSTGMRTHGKEGGVPASGTATSIEIVQGGEYRHFMYSDGMTPAQLQAYKECRNIFMITYNEIPQYQSATADQVRFD